MTTVDSVTFNKALRTFQEFGPNRRIPREQRLQQEFANLDPSEIGALIERFREIEAKAYSIAERVTFEGQPVKAGCAELAAAEPILNSESVNHTFSQAMYFVRK